jgi:hypothetical protein
VRIDTVKPLPDPQEAYADTDGYGVLADVGRGDQQAEADKQGHDGQGGYEFHASMMRLFRHEGQVWP